MRHDVFKIIGSEKKLIYSEWLNKASEIIRSILYKEDVTVENENIFDEKDYWIAHVVTEDAVECRRETFQHDEQDRLIFQEVWVYGELFEEIKTEYIDNQIIVTTFTDGKEEYKYIQTELEEDSFKWENFDRGHLQDYYIEKYDKETRQLTQEKYDAYSELQSVVLETYNEFDKLTELVEVDNRKNIIKHHTFEYDGTNLIKAAYIDKIPDTYEEFHEYEYDEQGNCLVERVTGSRNLPLAYCEAKFDDKNRVVEEKGIQGGVYNSIHYEYQNRDELEFHFIHEYTED